MALPLLLPHPIRLPSSFPSPATTQVRRAEVGKRCGSGFSFSSPRRVVRRRGAVGASAFCNPLDDPLLKEAAKEPVAFLGGLFAGLLRLDLNEEPLRDWISKTVEAAGITGDEEEGSEESAQDDDAPQQIEIE